MAARQGVEPDRLALHRRRRVGQALLLVGLVIAGAGLATFHPPTCTSQGTTAPANCSPWETSQWLMITGVFIAVLGLLYLAYLLRAPS